MPLLVSSDQQVQSFCLHPAHKGASLAVVAGVPNAPLPQGWQQNFPKSIGVQSDFK